MQTNGQARYLTINEARERLSSFGFNKVTNRQVRRWAGNNTLPFFKHGKIYYIDDCELLNYFKKKQVEALRKAK
jgi:hypothetical protein